MGTFHFCSEDLLVNTVRNEWASFAAAFLSRVEVGSAQWHDMQITFYSGAFALKYLMEESSEDEVIAEQEVSFWANELNAFLSEVARRCENQRAMNTPLDRKQMKQVAKDMLAAQSTGFGEKECEAVLSHVPQVLRDMALTIFRTCVSCGLPTRDAFNCATSVSNAISKYGHHTP